MATPGALSSSSSSSSSAAAEKSAFVLVKNLKHEFEWYAFNISYDVEVNKRPPSILHYSIWKDFHQDGSKAVVKFKPPTATVKIEEEELGHCWAILGLEDTKKKTIYSICFEDQILQLTEDKAVVKSVGRLSGADVLTGDPTGKIMWESLESMPNYLSYLNAHIVPLSDKVYCLGGLTEVNHDHDPDGKKRKRQEKSPWAMAYDPRLEAWECLRDPPRLPEGGLVDGIFSTSAMLELLGSTAPRPCIVVGLPQQGLIQFYYADIGDWVEDEFHCCRLFHPKDLCGKPVAVGNTLYWYVVGTNLLGGYDLQTKTWSVGHITIHDDWDYVKDNDGYKDPPPTLAHIGGDMFCLLWVSPKEETNSKRLTSTSQNLVVRDCEEAKKLSHSRVLGSGENVKGNHADGCTSSGQWCSNKDSTRDEDLEFWREDLEFWRKSKAEYAHLLEQISEFDQILQTVLT